jgi:hypothetical protein
VSFERQYTRISSRHDFIGRNRILSDPLARRVVSCIRYRGRSSCDPNFSNAAGSNRIEFDIRDIQHSYVHRSDICVHGNVILGQRFVDDASVHRIDVRLFI